MVTLDLQFVHGTLWFLAVVLELGIVTVLVRRSLVREFPRFLIYVCAHLLDSAAAFLASHISNWAYFYVYWGWVPCDLVVTLVLLEGLYRAVLEPYGKAQTVGVAAFRVATLSMFALALYFAYAAPGHEQPRLIGELMVMDRSVTMIEAGLVFVLLLMCMLLGVAWRSFHFGIGFGLGLTMAVELANLTLRSQVGRAGDTWFYLLQAFAFDVMMGIWLYCSATVRTAAHDAPVATSAELMSWNAALEGMLNGRSHTDR